VISFLQWFLAEKHYGGYLIYKISGKPRGVELKLP
jgi:hypothetical protein